MALTWRSSTPPPKHRRAMTPEHGDVEVVSDDHRSLGAGRQGGHEILNGFPLQRRKMA
jgi:hypothetical protein